MPKATASAQPTPTAGEVYACRTPPATAFSVPDTGRYTCFKILSANKEKIVVAVLDNVWTHPPVLNDVADLPIMKQHRFSWNGRLAHQGLSADWWNPSELSELKDLHLLGRVELTETEHEIARLYVEIGPGAIYSILLHAVRTAEAEWRWHHDHTAYVDEVERAQADRDAKRQAEVMRYNTRLKKLTWEQLLSEMPFERWAESPPFPDAAFTNQARTKIRETQIALRDLGPKPKKAEVRAILRACVDWFNTADEQEGGIIETEEREDIYEALEEMAYVARQKSLAHEVDDWRTW